MARPSLLCVLGLFVALVLPVGALSLVVGVAGEWATGAPLSRVWQASRELEMPQVGEEVAEAASGMMAGWPKYYLAFGAACCLVAAAAGAALCGRLHQGWFALVCVPLLAVSPAPSVGWTVGWALGWAVAGFAGAVLVWWLRSRAQITVG